MSDSLIVREIETVIRDHLGAIKKEAHERVLQLADVDPDKAWQQIESAVDDYGRDMLTDATHWLRTQVNAYSSTRWNAAAETERRRRQDPA